MEFEVKGNLNIKNDCYLVPIPPEQTMRDSYALALKILEPNLQHYRKNPPLLIPLMRGGSKPFLNISGSFRSVLKADSQDIDYIPIKISRYDPTGMNKEGKPVVDENDLAQAYYAMRNHDEGVIIDDVFDKGITTERVKKTLMQSGKRIVIATMHRKPEMRAVETNADYWVRDYLAMEEGGVRYPPWLVYDWEIDDHSPELWRILFPGVGDLHPELLRRRLSSIRTR